MDIFKLNRIFWNFAFNNPEKIKPNHCAIYYFALEHCNRLGWKEKFGFPTSMVLEATGIKSYSVYKKTFDELVDFGFFKVIEYSKNQYSSNIIALKENYKALDKALDKAFIKHDTKQSESNVQSIDSIDKQYTINNKQINNKNIYRSFKHLSITNDEVEKLKVDYDIKTIDSILDNVENYKENKKYVSLYLTAKQWLKKEPKKSTTNGMVY